MATSGAELAQQELVEEFEMFDNWMDRYQYIIDMGKQLPDFPEERRTEEYKIHGCQTHREMPPRQPRRHGSGARWAQRSALP